MREQLLWELGSDDEPVQPIADEKVVAEVEAVEAARVAEEAAQPTDEWLGGDGGEADESQPALFENAPSWENHWKGMPEFAQRSLDSDFSVKVNFRSIADRDAFAALVGQRVTDSTRSIWYPKAEIVSMRDKVYVDGDRKDEA